MTARLTLRLGLAFALAALSACVETAPAAPAVPLRTVPVPESFLREAINSAIGEVIAEECPGEFRHNSQALDASVLRFVQANQNLAAYSPAEWEATVNGRDFQFKVQDAAFSYISKRKVVVTDPASWCEAGRYETANRTAVGAFLIAK